MEVFIGKKALPQMLCTLCSCSILLCPGSKTHSSIKSESCFPESQSRQTRDSYRHICSASPYFDQSALLQVFIIYIHTLYTSRNICILKQGAGILIPMLQEYFIHGDGIEPGYGKQGFNTLGLHFFFHFR